MDPANTAPLLDDETAVGRHGADSDAAGTPTLRALDDHFPLAASGDRIELRRNGTAVAVVDYDRAPEGHRWRADWGEWRPRGYDPRPVVRTESATVRPFVLPDSPEIPVEPLRAADDRLFLAGYTLGSERVADLLVATADRGVDVRVLVEGSPVGGFSARSARLLDRIVAAGVEVRVLDGNPERFRFHHAKYAVADDRAIVLTENWKASGTGGRTNRGWGVVTGTSRSSSDETVADDLAVLFREDVAASDARAWSAFRNDTEFHDSGTANGSYPTRFEPPAATTADVELLTTRATPPTAWSRGSTPLTTACWAWSRGPAGRTTGSSARSGGPPTAGSTFISCCPARGTTARRTARWSTNSPMNRLRWPSPNPEADSGRFSTSQSRLVRTSAC